MTRRRTIAKTMSDAVSAISAAATGLVGDQPAAIAAAPGEMPLYRGTKELRARPMTRGEYNDYRGWTLPETESAEDPGYLVEYVDGGNANDERHEGYISWSPADVFERTYKLVGDDVQSKRENAQEFATAASEHLRHVSSEADRADYEAANLNECSFAELPENAPLQLRFANGSEFVGGATAVKRDQLAPFEGRATYEKPVVFELHSSPTSVSEAWLIAASGEAVRCALVQPLPTGGGHEARIPAGFLLF